MEFEDILMQEIVPIFNRYNFVLSKDYMNCFRFRSEVVEVIISYNEYDHTGTISVGCLNKMLSPISNEYLKDVLKLDLNISNASKDVFVENLKCFLLNEGQPILQNDLRFVSEIGEYIVHQASVYTSAIIQDQHLQSAKKAWIDGNYTLFLYIINTLEISKLPILFQRMYKTAVENLNRK